MCVRQAFLAADATGGGIFLKDVKEATEISDVLGLLQARRYMKFDLSMFAITFLI